MDDSTLVQVAMVIYMVGATVFAYQLTGGRERWSRLPVYITWVGFLVHTTSLVWRWIHSYSVGFGHAPLTNRYESLVFFSWAIIVMFLLLYRSLHLHRLGALILPLSAASIGSTSLIPGASADIEPLVPALQSNWLFFHVVTCFLSYSAFAIAFFVGILSLIQHRKSREISAENLDSIMHRTVLVGFLLLTLGIISGSAWAYNAWGRYWGWDPKEVWSLITWIVYAIFLHARVTQGWSGKRLAWISIIGFLFVLFTFLGVNYLPIFKGLHTYA